MAAASTFSQNKRRRNEHWNSGLAFPDAKRTNYSGLTLAQDSDLVTLLDEIDKLDANNSNQEQTDAVNEFEISEMSLNGVIESFKDEIELKAQTEKKIGSSDEKGSADQMGSFKESELTANGSNSKVTSLCDIGDLTYYDDVRGELGFFVDDISPDELGIIMDNYIDGDSMANIMFSDAVHGFAETTEDLYGSLWEHDIWHLNEHPVIQDFESPKQEKVGLVVSEAELPDVWNNILPIQQ